MEFTLQGLIANSKDVYNSNLVNSFSCSPRRLYQFLKVLKSEWKTMFLVNNSKAFLHDPSIL